MSSPVPPRNFGVSFKSPTSRSGSKTSDEGNPLSSLHFEPAWDSDELYDALRIAYPQIRSHKDRFLRAVIEFYDAELGRARNLVVGSVTPSSPDNLVTTDVFMHPRESSSSSEESGSPRWQPSGFHGPSASVYRTQKRKRSGIEAMQATFSIVPGGGKPRTKRPMTDAEREQYKHTKKVGACDPCRKRKRKCVCKLATETPISDVKKPRLAGDCSPIDNHMSSPKESTAATDDSESGSDHNTNLPAFNIPGSQNFQTIEEAPEEMAVSRVSRSLSLSPLSKAFDANFDPSSFLLCPELNLGDLAMPGNPISSLDFQEEHLSCVPMPVPKSTVASDHLVKSPLGYLDCEAFVNFQEPATDPDASTQHGVVRFQSLIPSDCASIEFTKSLQLISRASTALVPFSRLAADAQILLSDLGTLKMQLELLRKPPPYLLISSKYQNAFRDLAIHVNKPLQEFLARLEQVCGVDGHMLGMASTSTTSQFRRLKWVQGVRDDASILRALIANRISTIGWLMTLISMDTLREVHGMLDPTQMSENNIGWAIGTMDGFVPFS